MPTPDQYPPNWPFDRLDLDALDAYYGLRTMWQAVHRGQEVNIDETLRDTSERYMLTQDEVRTISDMGWLTVFGVEPEHKSTGWSAGDGS